MKKAMVFISFCLVTVYVFGQDYCWYSQGQKTCHEVSETKVMVQPKIMVPPIIIDITDIKVDITGIKNALTDIIADNLWEIYELDNGLLMIEMQNPCMENILELMRELNAREDVAYVSPVLLDRTGLEMGGYKNQIVVMLKSLDDYPVLQKCAEDYQIKDIKLAPFTSYTYLLTLPHNAKKDAMRTSLELFETSLFEFAEPNFFHFLSYVLGQPSANTRPYLGGGLSIIYPNPVSNVLFIDLEKKANTPNKTAASYDIRLYDSQGKMLRQTSAKGGIVEFNVSNVPNSIYFLQICDDISTTPKTYKILVKH